MIDPVIGVEFSDTVLSVNITNDLPLVTAQDITWFYNKLTDNTKIPLSGGGHYSISEDRLSLKIFNLSLSSSGVYTVEASNIVGIGTDNITLNVQSK